MKWNYFIALTAGWATLGTRARAQDPFTFETDAALFSTGDFNGDGRRDVVLIDRTTGTARLGFQQASGTFLWSDPQPTGIESPEALSVGRFYGPVADAFAVGSPAANRLHLLTMGSPAEVLTPREIFPSAPGPSSLAAFDIDGAGNADLMAIGEGLAPLTNKGRARVYEGMVSLNGTPTQAWTANFSGLTERINPARPKTGAAPRVCEVYFAAGSATAAFFLEVVGPAGVSGSINVSGISSNSRYAAASLDATSLSHFLFWSAGSPTLRVSRIQEPSAGTFAFGALNSYTLSKNIALVIPVQQGAGARIGVMFTDGTATVYDFDGASAPVVRQNLSNTGLDALLPLEGGDFLTLSNLAGPAPAWNRLHFNGAAYAATQTGALLAARPSQQVSNILFLSAEPFVNSGVTPKRLAHHREWTNTATFSSGIAWTFQSLAYTSAASGLGGAQSATLSGTAATDFPLVNQYAPTLSVFSPDNRSGTQLADLLFSPPPGTYAAPPVLTPLPGAPPIPASPAVVVRLSPTQATYRVFYRTSPTLDYQELGAPGDIPLTVTTTLYAYARKSDGTRTPVRTGTYTITPATTLTSPSASPDTDGDGLPDAWELAFAATDPAADPDGDGSNNFSEFQNGTDPGNAASVPAAPFQLTGQAVTIGNGKFLRLEWPASILATLEASSNLLTWTPITAGITQVGGQNRYDVSLSPPAPAFLYFRLHK